MFHLLAYFVNGYPMQTWKMGSTRFSYWFVRTLQVLNFLPSLSAAKIYPKLLMLNYMMPIYILKFKYVYLKNLLVIHEYTYF